MAEIWSVPTWLFFHTVAEKINEEFLKTNKTEVIHIFKEICGNLPCPDCRQHAVAYCTNLRPEKINNKENLIHFFYVFHNHVNKRTGKPHYPRHQLKKYKRGRLDVIFQKFIYGFMKKYSRTLYAGNLSQDAKRRRAGANINMWVQRYWRQLQGFQS